MNVPPLSFPFPDNPFSSAIPPKIEDAAGESTDPKDPNLKPPNVPSTVATSSDDVHKITSDSQCSNH